MPRKPLADDVVQTSIRLPRELLKALERIAGPGRVSSEIRERVEASLMGSGVAPVEMDAKTTELVRQMSIACLAVEQAYGPWWDNEFGTGLLIHASELIVASLGKDGWEKTTNEYREPASGSTLANAMNSPMLPKEHSHTGLARAIALIAALGNLIMPGKKQ